MAANKPTTLDSPTCRDCARGRGYVPANPQRSISMFEGRCANCGQVKALCGSEHWKPEKKRV